MGTHITSRVVLNSQGVSLQPDPCETLSNFQEIALFATLLESNLLKAQLMHNSSTLVGELSRIGNETLSL